VPTAMLRRAEDVYAWSLREGVLFPQMLWEL
jgi:hypothetical protein